MAEAKADDRVVRQAKEAVKRFTGMAVVPVMRPIAGEIRPIGTGTLLRVNSRLFVITAAHLFDDAALNQFYLPTSAVNGKAAKIIGSIVRAKNHDEIDIAVIEILDQHLADALRQGWQPVTLAQVGEPTDQGQFVLVGYPSERQQIRDTTYEYGVCTAFTSRIAIPSNANGASEEIDLFFKYAKTAIDEDGKPLSTPHLRGASGGSVWQYRDPSAAGIWSPEKSLTLVGVQASTMDGEWFRATRWSVVLDALGYKDDELRAAISSKN